MIIWKKKKSFINLLGFLQHQNFSDLDGIHLFLELKFLQEILPQKKKEGEKKTVIDILNFIKKLNCFPYRILLIINVIVTLLKEFCQIKILICHVYMYFNINRK